MKRTECYPIDYSQETWNVLLSLFCTARHCDRCNSSKWFTWLKSGRSGQWSVMGRTVLWFVMGKSAEPKNDSWWEGAKNDWLWEGAYRRERRMIDNGKERIGGSEEWLIMGRSILWFMIGRSKEWVMIRRREEWFNYDGKECINDF